MRRWFLSYHSPDEALAARLKDAIEAKDAAARVFFAPAHLRAGGSWSAQLAQEIAEANAFILLIGESGLGKWQVPEYYEAHDRHVGAPTEFPLIVVLLEGQNAPGLPFLRQMHWIVTADPAAETSIARLFDATAGHGSTPGQLWRYTGPYRGLAAMEEKDSDYFFGRARETVDVLNALAAPNRLPILIGNSGVGKSSLAQAGVIAALKQQAWPEAAAAASVWPAVFAHSRQWCYLTLKPGTDPLKALVEAFLDTWQFDATDFERTKQQNGWIELLRDGKASLPDLIDATVRRRKELKEPEPNGFLLYVDQGEELYIRAEAGQRRRFSELLAQALPDHRLRTMMSMRADFLGALQADKPLFNARQQIDVPPLGEEELREVISRPAQLLGARFENDRLIEVITRRTVEDSVKDVGALPLLSYTLDDMWTQMQAAQPGDGILRLPAPYFELGRVLVDRANSFLATHPDDETALRRILTLKLATLREGEEPTRRRAVHSEFSEAEWHLIGELANHPYRLLVTARPKLEDGEAHGESTDVSRAVATISNGGGTAASAPATPHGETYAEVAHEALFRRWDRLREWVAAEREFLAWRSSLEAARRSWQSTPHHSRYDALLMGAALAQAQSWLSRRPNDLHGPDREFITLSVAREKKVQTRARSIRALIYMLLVGMIVGLLGWINQAFLKQQWRWYATERPFASANMRPYVLTADAERSLKPDPSKAFRECVPKAPGRDFCPDMLVVPAGNFMMGAAPGENGQSDEQPRHQVTLGKALAVSKFELTFDEWDTCASYGECRPDVRDADFGRGQRPAINVDWDDAQQYVAWLSKMTGKPYRLLTEAEYEYVARAGTQTAYPWGANIEVDGKPMADCNGCGSQWDAKQTAPVGSFPPNRFGLFDTIGNVWEWVTDCYHPNYNGAPADGSAWTADDCDHRVDRGGGFWRDTPQTVRSASRDKGTPDRRGFDVGFRVARDLNQ